MKITSKILSSLLLVAGLIIIIVGYYIFLYSYYTDNALERFYLSLIATCVVYLVVAFRSLDIFGAVKSVSEKSPGYGLYWAGVWIYVPLAIVVIVLTLIRVISFKFALIAHLILLFVLFSFFLLGKISQENTKSAMTNIENRKESSQGDIRTTFFIGSCFENASKCPLSR